MSELDSYLKSLIDRFSSMIRHVIGTNLYKTDDIDIEDIEQEVKFKIWMLLKKGKKVENLPSYIKRVAYTATVDELRKMKKQNPASEIETHNSLYSMSRLKELGNAAESPELLLESKETRGFLEDLIDSLRQSRKQVLRLYLMGMSVEEICEFFDWDKTKVRHLLYRGIEDMREKMKSLNVEPLLSGDPKLENKIKKS
ncbi:MAG: sigma-70 family RNA polymerase sigma factor [Candidatus Aminicenantes bacterium]|nr:sigma-70 family RNA polymerase sigma factor [Candidatus Aminicenantes bacterium]